MDKLKPDQIQARLADVNGWWVEDGALKKDYKFADFKQAMAFINKLAAEAEKLNHHPDWSNSYNKVPISLSTHSAGGVTDADFKLAKLADGFADAIK